MPESAAYASAGLIGGFAIAGAVIRVVREAARWIVRKTPTRADDKVLADIENWVARNPAAADLLEQLLRRIRGT